MSLWPNWATHRDPVSQNNDKSQPGVMAYVDNATTLEAEAGG
jgi:hypothetical protein